MPEVPPHPDTPHTSGRAPADRTRPWWVYCVSAVAIALIVLVVVLPLTGTIGPGSH